MATEATILLIATVVGVLLRVILPYVKKVKEGTDEPVTFQKKYIATAIIGLVVSVFTVLEALAMMPVIETVNIYALIFAGLTYGYAFQSTVNLFPDAV